MLQRFAQALRGWTRPAQDCVLCAAPARQVHLCEACHTNLPWHQQAQCPLCALPSADNAICGACQKRPPAFDATRAALVYQHPVSALVQQYKYGHSLYLGRVLAQALRRRLGDAVQVDALVPMPLSVRRLRERGFNQAHEIAKHLAHDFALPLAWDTCSRVRDTRAQTELPVDARAANVRGAFAVQRAVPARVAIVDDVMTSGASVQELSRVLKQASAQRVEVWVVARALPH